MRTIVVGLACFAAISAALAQGIPVDEAGFTDYVAEQVRREVGDASVLVKGPLTLNVGTDLQANLDRVYSFCKRNSEGCREELDRYVAGIGQALRDQNLTPSKDAVRLVLRTTKYAEGARAAVPATVARDFAPGLVVLPVIDTPRTILMLGDRQFKSLGLGLDEVYALGESNLRKELKPLMEVSKPVVAGEIGRIAGNAYDHSRLILHNTWEPLARAQGGTLIATVPATDAVFYIGADTSEAIDALRTLTCNVFATVPNPLSDRLLRWRASGWELVDVSACPRATEWNFGSLRLAGLEGFEHQKGSRPPERLRSGDGTELLVSVYRMSPEVEASKFGGDPQALLRQREQMARKIFEDSVKQGEAVVPLTRETLPSGNLFSGAVRKTGLQRGYFLTFLLSAPTERIALVTVEGRGDAAEAYKKYRALMDSATWVSSGQ